MLVRNVWVYKDGNLVLDSEFELPGDMTVESVDFLGQAIVLPGLYDSHIHGVGGHDFSEGTIDAYRSITDTLGACGVAYCAATFVSMDIAALKHALKTLDEFIQQPVRKGAAQIIAVHLEGPFITHECKGAHDPAVLQDKISQEIVFDIIKEAPHVPDWKITLAPELPGALEFMNQIKDRQDIHIFVGHCNSATAILEQASECGIAGFTHLGNANAELVQRLGSSIAQTSDARSNVVRFALEHKFLVELIVDGQHLSSEFVAFVHSKLSDRIILVSDALSPANMLDGEYQLGTLTVLKQGARIVLKDNPEKLAGSAACLPDLIPHFIAMLQKAGIDEQQLLTSLYHATVTNPRSSSSSATFANEDNYVILNKNTGQLIMSHNHGLNRHHSNITTQNSFSFFTPLIQTSTVPQASSTSISSMSQ